jgi:hypothetical protein
MSQYCYCKRVFSFLFKLLVKTFGSVKNFHENETLVDQVKEDSLLQSGIVTNYQFKID